MHGKARMDCQSVRKPDKPGYGELQREVEKMSENKITTGTIIGLVSGGTVGGVIGFLSGWFMSEDSGSSDGGK